MVLLTAHQSFLLKSLPTEEEPDKEINLQDFYIKFGFLKRETAENAFQRALSKIYSLDTVTDDQKAYIKELYYETDSIEAFETLELNEYWKTVERTEREEVVVKKRQEAFSSNLIAPVRNPKGRRIAVNTIRNKIMDLSNSGPSGPSGQSTVAFASLKKEAKTVKVPLPLLPSAVEDSINKNFTKNISLEIKFDNLTKKMQMESEYEAIVCFKLLTHFVETHILNPDVFIISKLKQFSEMDMNLFFWGRVFVLLFPGSGDLKIRSGEVKLESSTFKIDYKVGCFVKEKFVTISCIEVGKFVESNKVRDDHHKLLLEGKTIINNIIKEFKFIDPKSIPVLGVQICGIKGDLVEIILASKKLYVAHRPLKRLRVPLNCNDSDSANTFLRQLLYYKKHLADFSYDLKQMVNNHDDKRASFERVLGSHLFIPPNYIDWIDDCVERL